MKKILIWCRYDYVTGNKSKIYDGCMRRTVGEIILNLQDHHFSDTQNWIEKAIEADNRNGTRWNLAEDYRLGLVFARQKEGVYHGNGNANVERKRKIQGFP